MSNKDLPETKEAILAKYPDAKFDEDGCCFFYDGHVNVEDDCTCDLEMIRKYDLWEFVHAFHEDFFNDNVVCKRCGNVGLGQQAVDEKKFFAYGMGGHCYACP